MQFLRRSSRFEWNSAKSFDEIPELPKWPLVGTLPSYLPIFGSYNAFQLHHANRAKYNQFGPVIRETILARSVLLIYHPDDIAMVFKAEGSRPFRETLMSLEAYRKLRHSATCDSASGLIISQGDEWYRMRRVVNTCMLKTISIIHHLPAIDRLALQALALLSRPNVDLHHVMYYWSLENKKRIICENMKYIFNARMVVAALQVLLEKEMGCLKEDHQTTQMRLVVEAIRDASDAVAQLEFPNPPWWRFIATPTWKTFVRSQDIFADFILQCIDERLSAKDGALDDRSVLGHLLLTEGLSKAEIATTINELVFASVDTAFTNITEFFVFCLYLKNVSIPLSWLILTLSMYQLFKLNLTDLIVTIRFVRVAFAGAFLLHYLARNPRCQERAYLEICSVLQSSLGPELNPEDIETMDYIRACLRETLRLRPVIPGVFRLTCRDLVLSGYQVPAGTTVFTQNQVSSTHEDFCPEPNQFKPERWLGQRRRSRFDNPLAAVAENGPSIQLANLSRNSTTTGDNSKLEVFEERRSRSDQEGGGSADHSPTRRTGAVPPRPRSRTVSGGSVMPDTPCASLHEYLSLPFGSGARACIGRRLAEMELVTLAVRVLQRFRITTDDLEDIDIYTGVVSAPITPIRCTFEPR